MALTLAQFLENAGAVNHARDFRRMQDKLLGWDVRVPNAGLATTGIANGGVARYYGAGTTGDLAVIQRAAGANMSVDVGAGFAMVGGTESATQGEYGAYNDATVNVTISASDPTNPRIDVIGIRIRDTEYSGANNDAAIIVVTGTPAGAPVVPTLPANFLSLAHVAVAALAASILTANITDKRQNLSSLGGVTVCNSSATYPTVNLWEGQMVYDRALDALLVYSGAAWIQIGPLSAWTAFTPTLTNITLNNGTLNCAYMRVGRFIAARYSLVWGNTTSAAGTQTFGLPVAANAIYIGNTHIGSGNVLDGGVASYGSFTLTVITAATNFGLESAGAGVFVNATVPITFGSTDGMTMHTFYEAAA